MQARNLLAWVRLSKAITVLYLGQGYLYFLLVNWICKQTSNQIYQTSPLSLHMDRSQKIPYTRHSKDGSTAGDTSWSHFYMISWSICILFGTDWTYITYKHI